MAGSDDDIPPPPPPPQTQTPTQQAPYTVSTIKLPILKKGEYDIWAMKMKHYLAHTDYPIWEVIQRGNGHDLSVQDSEGLQKGYDRFQILLSQLEIHGAGVTTEDANQKFLRSLPSAWSQVSLIMRTKPGVDSLNFDYLFNTLRVLSLIPKEGSSSYTDELINEFEMAAAIRFPIRLTDVIQKEHSRKLQFVPRKLIVFDKSKVECHSVTRTGHARECRFKGNQDSRGRDAWNTGNKDKDNERRSGKTGGTKRCDDEQRDRLVMRSSNIKDSPVNDRYAEGMHAVPPLMTGIYIPSGPDKEIDDSQFTYGPKQSKPSESDARSSDFNSCESNSSKETNESVPKPVANEPKAVSDPKVSSDAPIIEEYESDSDDEHVSLPTKEQETPSFAFVNTVKHVKTPRQTVKEQNTCSQNCDFHEKRMAKQAELNKRICKGTGQRENRPVWNNVQRVNHQNQFVPTTVLTRTGRIQVNTARASSTNNVNTARHNFNSQAVPTNATRKVNTVKPIVNNVRPKTIFYKNYSPIRRPFNKTTAPRTNFSRQKVNTAEVKAVRTIGGKRVTAIKPSAGCNGDQIQPITGNNDYPQRALKNKGIVDSGCSRHMTGNKAYLAEYQDYNGGPVAFGGSKGYITGKGKIKTGKLDFEDVCFVKELQHFNLFSVSQMCDKKNKVLFTDTECLVLSPDFKLPDENQVLLRVPRQNNMYSFNLENIVPSGGLACLIAKAIVDESNKWHRRLGHVNFKNLNKLVKGNLVRGLPSKIFQNDHTCVACQKGKQHKASCKAKSVSSISQPLQLLHMDLFGPTSVRSINHKTYCLVITDDFSRSKGIKREYSNARTPQQSGVAERKNRTLIEAARTMLADLFLPNTFWAYVLNRVLVTKPQNKTPYELITGKGANWLFYQPVRSENQANKHAGPKEANHSAGTQDNIDAGNSEMEAESTQDYFVLPIWFSYTSTVKSSEAKNEGKKPNKNTDLKINEKLVDQEDQSFFDELERLKRQEKEANDAVEALRKEFAQDTEELLLQARVARASSTNTVNTASTPVSAARPSGGLSYTDLTNTDQDDSQIPALEDIYDNPNDGIFTNASYDDEGAVTDFTNLETIVNILVDLPYGKKAIGTKWVYRNKKDERGVVVRNKARIEAIRIFLAFAYYMGFIVYQMDVKSAFLYGTIDEEVYVSQPSGFVDPMFPKKVYKFVKSLYGLHQAPRAWYATLSTFLLKSGYRRGTIDKTLFIKKDKNDIIQDKYVAEILKKFNFASVKTASTPIETQKPLVKDEEAADVDVTPKTSHLNAVKRIFRYLKGKPKLGLWYPRVSSFDLEAYSDSDYAGANLDRKSTTGGCQFLGRRLISWQCKKQTIVATSTTEAEYVAAANCCGQVLWIQNQMLDYGFNFMNTNIYIDNESTICVVKNLVFYSKTKHIEIRHHFIRDAYEKKLIQAASVKGRQDDLLYSLYGMFCEQKNLDNDDFFHRVI
ncbi:putative ribonuclease H-like domain-containing protein [Tanacetum coccineum]|uniref:Ribonuclease H-like domain-containing protein n=1 Tax=Tanacetum coccineum TaxID=301880 RepID=A0ABQ5J9W3_9ASTR